MFLSYLLIFIGILLGGEIIWLPVLYLAYTGMVNLWGIFTLGIFAMLVADAIWYSIGRYMAREKIFSLPILRKKKYLTDNFDNFFSKWGSVPIIIVSKFFYGSRIITLILCGINKMKWSLFAPVMFVANLIWAFFSLFLVSVVGTGINSIENIAENVQIGVAIFVIFVLLLNYGIKLIFNRIRI